jgi:FkbM family methyltransferase
MHAVHKQRLQLLFAMDEMISALEDGTTLPDECFSDFADGLLSLLLPEENILFDTIKTLKNGNYGENINQLRKQFDKIYNAMFAAAGASVTISENYRNSDYGCDREFMGYMNLIKSNSAETLRASAYEKLEKLYTENRGYYDLITRDSYGWYMEDNWLDGIDGANNSLIINRMETLKNNADHLEWLYENLADSISRRSLNALIKYWLTWDFSDWKKIARYYCDVVDTNIFSFYDDEVFVDCGGYTGDTVAQYVNTVNRNYKRIYVYDISSTHVSAIKKNLASLPNVIVNHKGVGDINTEMTMYGSDKFFTGNRLVSANIPLKAVEKVKVVRLDEDINEPVTFIKIDVEGYDKEALRGASGLIKNYHPKLSVDAYHQLADIVNIPLLIREIDSSYNLYLRLPLIYDDHIRFPFPAFMAV